MEGYERITSWSGWYRLGRQILDLGDLEAARYADARTLEDTNRATRLKTSKRVQAADTR